MIERALVWLLVAAVLERVQRPDAELTIGPRHEHDIYHFIVEARELGIEAP